MQAQFIFLLISLLGAVSFAATQRTHLIIADRYSELHSESLEDLIPKLSSSSRPDRTIFPSESPLLSQDGDDLIETLKRSVLLSNPKNRLHIDLLLNTHGSKTAIHSEVCDPVSQQGFANQLVSLFEVFKEAGYSSERLSFRIYANFCYSGVFNQSWPKQIPFETLIISSASDSSVSMSDTIEHTLGQTLALQKTAKEQGLKLCPDCTPNQELFLLFQNLGRFDINTGHEDYDPPTAILMGPQNFDQTQHFGKLTQAVIQLYYESLVKTTQQNSLIRMSIEGIYADEGSSSLRDSLRGLRNQLSIEQSTGLELLEMMSRFDDHSEAEVLTRLKHLGTHPNPYIRESVDRILMTYVDLWESPIKALQLRFDQELRQPEPNYFGLMKLNDFLKKEIGDESAETTELCERFLTL